MTRTLDRDSLPGTVSHYRIEAEVRRGPSGAVYRARRVDGEPVALTILSSALIADNEFRARFAREADVVVRVAHPHWAVVRDNGITADGVWIAAEYVVDASLRAVLHRKVRLIPAQACRVVIELLSGLGAAHSFGLVHRNISPDNVWFDHSGVVKLTDCGLVAGRTSARAWRPIDGNPTYMSPERVRGEPLDARSDVYAVGAVLYELLTGRPLFGDCDQIARLDRQRHAPVPDMHSLPPGIGQVVSCALAKNPDARPNSADEMAARLQHAADQDLPVCRHSSTSGTASVAARNDRRGGADPKPATATYLTRPVDAPETVVSVRSLRHEYWTPQGALPVLVDVTVDLCQREIVAITGRSGAGKTTLLSILGGLERPQSGTVRVAGHDLRALGGDALAAFRRTTVGFVFQDFGLLGQLTALQNVEVALRFAGISRPKRRTRARDLLGEVGLSHRMHHRAHALSGGENQRVAIARALANTPVIVLADEPTGNLDLAATHTVIDLLTTLPEQYGCTVIVATHDPVIAARASRQFTLDAALTETP